MRRRVALHRRLVPGALFDELARALGPDQRVLVAYLQCATDSVMPAFRRECATTRPRVAVHELPSFERAAAIAERFLKVTRPLPSQGMALFVLPSARRGAARLLPLPAVPVEAVGWVSARVLPRLAAELSPRPANGTRVPSVATDQGARRRSG